MKNQGLMKSTMVNVHCIVYDEVNHKLLGCPDS